MPEDIDWDPFTTEKLLRAFAALTHQMHGDLDTHRAEHPLRLQRNAVEAEILRRAGCWRSTS